MKKSFQIFKRDLGRLFRNRAAVLILVGISVLPSLYAWFNIAANMDPYGNTKGIQVAIANEDKGADSEQMSLDAGQNIVDNLKKNDQLGWKFVDAKEAKKGVRSGKYYAAIVIPDNFSESLLSILSGDIKQPKLDYYINEKKNAIAPKITDTGASTIQQEINDTFTSVAAESISELLSKEAGELSGKVSEGNSSLIKAIADTRNGECGKYAGSGYGYCRVRSQSNRRQWKCACRYQNSGWTVFNRILQWVIERRDTFK